MIKWQLKERTRPNGRLPQSWNNENSARPQVLAGLFHCRILRDGECLERASSNSGWLIQIGHPFSVTLLDRPLLAPVWTYNAYRKVEVQPCNFLLMPLLVDEATLESSRGYFWPFSMLARCLGRVGVYPHFTLPQMTLPLYNRGVPINTVGWTLAMGFIIFPPMFHFPMFQTPHRQKIELATSG